MDGAAKSSRRAIELAQIKVERKRESAQSAAHPTGTGLTSLWQKNRCSLSAP
jgi:hypothetical protein